MTDTLSRRNTIVAWVAQLVAAVILAQSLFFKFTGAPESVEIFGTLGVEPWGRWLTGVLELVAVILLVRPRTAALGAGLGLVVMVGAIGSHLTVLGIEVAGDGGLLFGMAVLVLVACATVALIRRGDLERLLGRAGA